MREKPRKTPRNGKKQPDQTRGTRMKIEHMFPPDQRVQFSNHVTVQHSNEGEFVISFYEITPPIILDENDIAEHQKKHGDSVPANCIVRVAVAAARMPKLIGALVSNFEQFEKDTGISPENEGEQKNAS